MSYQITSTNFELSSKVTELANEKLHKIEKYTSDAGDELTDLRAIINKGPRYGFRVKIELWIPLGTFVAKAAGFNLEGTIDDAIGEIIRQLNKHKGKAHNKDRRLLRRMKYWMFFSKHSDEI